MEKKLGTILVPYKIDNLDYHYGGYTSVDSALDALTGIAKPGRQFIVTENGVTNLYLFQGDDKEPILVGESNPTSLNIFDKNHEYKKGDLFITENGNIYKVNENGIQTNIDSLEKIYGLNFVPTPKNNTNEYRILGDGSTELIVPQEIVADGLGIALRSKKNSLGFEPTGEKAIDLSYSADTSSNTGILYGASGKFSFAQGEYALSKGWYSIAMGYATIAEPITSIALGQNNQIRHGQSSGIVGGAYNKIGELSYNGTDRNRRGMNSIILGGNNNSIQVGINNGILGGLSNRIIDQNNSFQQTDSISNVYSLNVICGGLKNLIDGGRSSFITGESNLIKKYNNNTLVTSQFLCGSGNISQGSFTFVSGFGNHAVTQGESIFGFFATIQDTNLTPNTYYPQGRLFAIGCGKINGTVIDNANGGLSYSSPPTRKDAFTVFQDGNVYFPSLTLNSITNSSNGSIAVTKEYVTQETNKLNTKITTLETKITNLETNNNTTPDSGSTDIILKSPNGTNFLLSVEDDGVLYTEETNIDGTNNITLTSNNKTKFKLTISDDGSLITEVV